MVAASRSGSAGGATGVGSEKGSRPGEAGSSSADVDGVGCARGSVGAGGSGSGVAVGAGAAVLPDVSADSVEAKRCVV